MKPLTERELCALIVDFNAAAESYQAKALELLALGNVGRPRALLGRAVHWNGLAFYCWCALGRTDLLATRDMAAFARAQLGLPINDVFPARATPEEKPRSTRFGRTVSAEIVELTKPDLTPATAPPLAPWSRPIPQRAS